MKATTHKELYSAPTFKPFSLTITFNSTDEVRMMWHRLNMSVIDLYRLPVCDIPCTYVGEAWKALNTYVKENNITIRGLDERKIPTNN